MTRSSRYSFPHYKVPKALWYMIATMLLLNIAALAVLGEITAAERRSDSNQMGESAQASTDAVSISLEKSDDMGQGYIDSMVFFGESTTAHLRSRGVLSGGRSSCQVWANESNTMMLSTEICKQRIIYPETGERMTVVEAAAKKQPKYLVLSFGINGLSQFVANPAVYSLSYTKLITAVRQVSPKTIVLLQTVYPVARSYEDAARVNADIARLNGMLPEIAAKNGAYLLDTASALRGEDGMLREEYAMEDGLHLSTQAYIKILQYLRTHGAP